MCCDLGKSPVCRQEDVKSLLLPYLIWSVVQILVMYVLGRYTNNHISLHRLLTLGWEPVSPFLVPVRPVWLHVDRHPGCAVPLAVSVRGGDAFPHLEASETLFQFAYFFAWYVSGCLLGGRSLLAPASDKLVIVVNFAASRACGFVWHLDYYSPLMLPATIAGIVFVIAMAQRLPAIEAILFAGRASLVIYVMHILCAAGMRIALKIAGIQNAGVHVVLGVVAGVVLPLCIYAVLDRLNLARLLGLPPHAWGQHPKPVVGI